MTDEHVRKIAAWLQAEAVAEREAREADVGKPHKPGSTAQVFISRKHACAKQSANSRGLELCDYSTRALISREHACALALMGRGR